MATETAQHPVPPPGGPALDSGPGASVAERDDTRPVVDLTAMDGAGGLVLVPDPAVVEELLSGFIEVPVPSELAPASRPLPPDLIDLVRLVAFTVAAVTWPSLVLLLPVSSFVAFVLVVGGWGLAAFALGRPVDADDPDPPEA